MVVGGAADAVDGRVAHIDVGAGHVDLGAQHGSAVVQFAVAHLTESCQVFCHGAAAKRAVHAGLAKVAPVGAHVFCALLVHIGVAGFDQGLGCAVHEFEVVAGLVWGGRACGLVQLGPVKTQPLHRVDDAIDVFGVFFFRVGVVKAQVADAAIVARQPKVNANALGVPDVQIAVGLGRKAGADFGRVALARSMVRGIARATGPAARAIAACGQVVLNNLPQKITGFAGFGRAGGLFRGGRAHAADFRRRTVGQASVCAPVRRLDCAAPLPLQRRLPGAFPWGTGGCRPASWSGLWSVARSATFRPGAFPPTGARPRRPPGT